jgi:iron complex transport system ATP-binding protein
MNNALFKIEKLFFSISAKPILNDINFEIETGDYLTIIGPNGAGKTTLLKCLMGINGLESGEILFHGNALSQIKQKDLAKNVAYVPQNDGRSLPFSVKEFIMLARYPHLSPFSSYSKNDMEIVAESLEVVGIQRLRNRRLSTLSGGERQMVLIASALAQQTEVILFDEPTAFLDPKYEEAIYTIMEKIHKNGKTVVMVTHDLNGAILHSTRLLIIKEGQLVYNGNPQDIVSGDILSSVYEKPFLFMKHPQNGKSIIVPGALQ